MVSNCEIPEDLYYFVEKHVWAKPEESLIRVGVTDVLQSLADKIMFFTPRRVGRTIMRSDPLAILESGKWLGMVPSPLAGEVVEYNPALSETPTLLNTDPYGNGWLALVHVADWSVESQGLVTGKEGVAFYQRFLEREEIRCR